MPEEFYQNKLYPMQDEVMDLMGHLSNNFYLTGGTALSRFYLNHRYSDDLDFFTNRDNNFQKDSDNFIEILKKNFDSLSVEIRSQDFVRMVIIDNNVNLKIELINDVGFHFDGINNFNCKVDNWQNILSNKICALSRNSAKDYADILFLSLKFNFNWIELFENAKAKDTWVNELEIAEIIDNFEIGRFKEIKWIDNNLDISLYQNYFHKIAQDILNGSDNSLFL